MATAHLAIDLGASSGRAMLGVLDGSPLRLALEEVHRFEHRGCPTPTGPVWNLTGLWADVLQGLRTAAARCRQRGLQLASIGVDTWGVDWTLVGREGELVGLPHCYRDPRNQAACDEIVASVGGYRALYERTGIQLMPFNTLFQLAAARKAEPRLFDAAERLLFLPDLFHYWLSDVQAVERTIASTSSMLDVRTGDWDRELVASIGVDPRLLGPIVEPGTPLGVLRRDVADETSAPHDVRVIAPASHDTASAVAAAPSSGQPGAWAYLSSGTWSLLGAELTAPHVTDASAEAPFTHERGVYGTIRFLKNIAGLWLVQELRRELAAAGEELSFAELARQAEAAPRFRTLVNPNDARFAAPGPMRPRIVAMAKETGQPAPETSGQFARACFESLALCYGQTVDLLSQIVGQAPQALHIVGGGSQNRLLNTLTAGAVGCRVTAGPAEATAAGNALVQAIGREVVPDLRELRAIVARSFDVEFVPAPTRDDAWRAARDRYDQLTA